MAGAAWNNAWRGSWTARRTGRAKRIPDKLPRRRVDSGHWQRLEGTASTAGCLPNPWQPFLALDIKDKI